MQVFTDETEFTDIRMIQRAVGMFESQRMQRIIACGLLGIEYDEDLDFDYFNSWPHNHNSFHGYQGNRRLSGSRTRSSSSVHQSPLSYHTSARDHLSPSRVDDQAKESNTERKARLLQETKKSKEKAEKKRLKKQKRKQRKQMEKDKQYEERKTQQSNSDDSKSVNVKKDADSRVKPSAEDTDSDSSQQESSDRDEDDKSDSGESEELDMTSTFVSKAALIAKRQLEQKSRCEKKKSPDKGKYRHVPDKVNEDEEIQKVSASFSSLTVEDNVKISTDLAIMGNKFASAGDFHMAVKYFTDAIKYNPKEFKLFGNRSFCFEKMQEYEKALIDAELSLDISPGWVKGLFRKGRALAGLKRYEEAAQAFQDVLRLDSSYAEAAQELMRVQIIQLMDYGFTREQSSNALIIHGNVQKALEVLSKLNHQPGAVLNGTPPPAQVANITGVSPVLSANKNPSRDVLKNSFLNRPSDPVPSVGTQPKPVQTMNSNGDHRPSLELFPVWVGNLIPPVSEHMITDLFSKVGDVYSVKLLSYKRCAFVNFTKQEHCDEAIRRFNGFMLNNLKIVVRYPDRIPPGMGISKSAYRAHALQDNHLRQNAAGGQKYFRPYKQFPDPKGSD